MIVFTRDLRLRWHVRAPGLLGFRVLGVILNNQSSEGCGFKLVLFMVFGRML